VGAGLEAQKSASPSGSSLQREPSWEPIPLAPLLHLSLFLGRGPVAPHGARGECRLGEPPLPAGGGWQLLAAGCWWLVVWWCLVPRPSSRAQRRAQAGRPSPLLAPAGSRAASAKSHQAQDFRAGSAWAWFLKAIPFPLPRGDRPLLGPLPCGHRPPAAPRRTGNGAGLPGLVWPKPDMPDEPLSNLAPRTTSTSALSAAPTPFE
jgi:hypothetical protein